MKKMMKLLILIVISLSVYWIYQKTSNSSYQITSIGDQIAEGINSYGIKESSYIDYLKLELEDQKEQIEVNKEYSKKDQSIQNIVQLLKTTPNIKRTLSDTNLLVITLGYNDLIYKEALEERITEGTRRIIFKEIQTDYQNLIKEIKKYYHEEIVVIGYFPSTNKDKNKEIQELNKILSQEDVVYIDTYHLLDPREKYFSNPSSYYPNREGYCVISKEIIKKTLEIPQNI